MNPETKKLIEQAFASLHEAHQSGNEMTEAGMLMYGLCLAVLDLDKKLESNPSDDEFKFI